MKVLLELSHGRLDGPIRIIERPDGTRDLQVWMSAEESPDHADDWQDVSWLEIDSDEYESIPLALYDSLASRLAAAEEALERERANLKIVQNAATMGINAAGAIGSAKLEEAQRLFAASSPEALESERQMNSILTAELEAATARAEKAERERAEARAEADERRAFIAGLRRSARELLNGGHPLMFRDNGLVNLARRVLAREEGS